MSGALMVRMRERRRGLGIGVLILMVWVIIVLHLIEVTVWAGFFTWKDAQPNIFSAFYNALVNYTTLGAGYLPVRWRLLEGMLGMAGLLSFAFSTSVLVAVAMPEHPGTFIGLGIALAGTLLLWAIVAAVRVQPPGQQPFSADPTLLANLPYAMRLGSGFSSVSWAGPPRSICGPSPTPYRLGRQGSVASKTGKPGSPVLGVGNTTG